MPQINVCSPPSCSGCDYFRLLVWESPSQQGPSVGGSLSYSPTLRHAAGREAPQVHSQLPSRPGRERPPCPPLVPVLGEAGPRGKFILGRDRKQGGRSVSCREGAAPSRGGRRGPGGECTWRGRRRLGSALGNGSRAGRVEVGRQGCSQWVASRLPPWPVAGAGGAPRRRCGPCSPRPGHPCCREGSVVPAWGLFDWGGAGNKDEGALKPGALRRSLHFFLRTPLRQVPGHPMWAGQAGPEDPEGPEGPAERVLSFLQDRIEVKREVGGRECLLSTGRIGCPGTREGEGASSSHLTWGECGSANPEGGGTYGWRCPGLLRAHVPGRVGVLCFQTLSGVGLG